uniref:Ig-like domain-containing protein n=1 Tax=Xiphophorus couchianus TaxID=32473 RepID=A0A3B5L3I2_9TELE
MYFIDLEKFTADLFDTNYVLLSLSIITQPLRSHTHTHARTPTHACLISGVSRDLHATKGDTVKLPCTFTSTANPTSKMRVSWSYTPQTGGSSLFFHFSSKAELPKSGQFAGRIKWQGTPARGDVSISLINATLNDNGTYTCDVTNPPDVFDSPKSHTVLTVTPKATTIRFSDVAVLLAFILLPSGLITFFLIGRMFCPKKRHNQSKAYRSPIEVTEG